MSIGPGISAILELVTTAALLLAALGLTINAAAALVELWRSRILRKYFSGKARSDGFAFTSSGLKCRVWHNKFAVPLEIELKHEFGRLMILGPQSLWGLEKGLRYRQDQWLDKQQFIIGSDSQDLLEKLIKHPKFQNLLRMLFHRSNPHAMWIQVRKKNDLQKRKPVLIYSAMPEGIYHEPKALESTVNQIAEVFELKQA